MSWARKGDAAEMTAKAARLRLEAEASKHTHSPRHACREADQLETQTRLPLPDHLSEAGSGGELVPFASTKHLPGEDSLSVFYPHYRDTITDPDYLAAAASQARIELAHGTGALELAVDTADTIQAKNSLEKMLAHQIAAAHHSTMKLDAQLNAQLRRMDNTASPTDIATLNVEVARLANSTGRMMAAFQQGLTTLQRLKTGPHQTVVVKHVYQQVNVSEGGQAVVSGETGGGGGGPKRRGRVSKNEQ